MHERKRNLVVRLDEDEHAMAVAIAEARDEPMAVVVRKLLRAEYVDRIGLAPPKTKSPTTK
jgi:hypothetical protein